MLAIGTPATRSACSSPATTDADALAVVDRIRGNVERMPLLAESCVTVSVGVATGAGTDLVSTIQRADEALASGSSSGANQAFTERRSTGRALAVPSMTAAPMTSPAPAPDPTPSEALSPEPTELASPASAPFAPPSI
jgi:hypothetical protein